jgi:hypothetical protein
VLGTVSVSGRQANPVRGPAGPCRVSDSPNLAGPHKIKDPRKCAFLRLIPGMVLPVPPGAPGSPVRPLRGAGWSDSQINARPRSIALPLQRSQSHVSASQTLNDIRHAARPVQTVPPHLRVWAADPPRAPRLRHGGHRCGPRGARPRGLPLAGARPRRPTGGRTPSRTLAEVAAGPGYVQRGTAPVVPVRSCGTQKSRLWSDDRAGRARHDGTEPGQPGSGRRAPRALP